jgi:hypothetical protein
LGDEDESDVGDVSGRAPSREGDLANGVNSRAPEEAEIRKQE